MQVDKTMTGFARCHKLRNYTIGKNLRFSVHSCWVVNFQKTLVRVYHCFESFMACSVYRQWHVNVQLVQPKDPMSDRHQKHCPLVQPCYIEQLLFFVSILSYWFCNLSLLEFMKHIFQPVTIEMQGSFNSGHSNNIINSILT